MDVLCTFKISIESQNFEHECTKYQLPYLNQDQDAEFQSGASSIILSYKSKLEGHRCSLNHQNQDSKHQHLEQGFIKD